MTPPTAVTSMDYGTTADVYWDQDSTATFVVHHAVRDLIAYTPAPEKPVKNYGPEWEWYFLDPAPVLLPPEPTTRPRQYEHPPIRAPTAIHATKTN